MNHENFVELWEEGRETFGEIGLQIKEQRVIYLLAGSPDWEHLIGRTFRLCGIIQECHRLHSLIMQ